MTNQQTPVGTPQTAPYGAGQAESPSEAPVHHETGPPSDSTNPQPARRRRWPLYAVAAVVVLGAGAAFGSHAYAKNEICDSFANPQAASAVPPTADDLARTREDVEALRMSAKLLMFDGDLKSAVLQVADDSERAATLTEQMLGAKSQEEGAAMVPQLMAVAGSLDTRVRTAQRACGQSETGVTGP